MQTNYVDQFAGSRLSSPASPDTMTSRAQRIEQTSERVLSMVREIAARLTYAPPIAGVAANAPVKDFHIQLSAETTDNNLTAAEEILSSLLNRI